MRLWAPRPSATTRGREAALVEELPALLGAAVAGQLVAGVLDGELVVVGELLPPVDLAHGEDDDVLLPVDVDDPRVAVGLAGVVDEARGVSVHRGVHHLGVVDAEHVAADALRGGRGRPRHSAQLRPDDSSQPFSEGAYSC